MNPAWHQDSMLTTAQKLNEHSSSKQRTLLTTTCTASRPKQLCMLSKVAPPNLARVRGLCICYIGP